MLQCVASRASDGGEPISETFHVILQFQQVQTPPPPLIVQPVADTLFVGDGVRLDCQLPLDRGMPHIELVWGFPQEEALLEEAMEAGRIIIGTQVITYTLSFIYQNHSNSKSTATLTTSTSPTPPYSSYPPPPTTL